MTDVESRLAEWGWAVVDLPNPAGHDHEDRQTTEPLRD